MTSFCTSPSKSRFKRVGAYLQRPGITALLLALTWTVASPSAQAAQDTKNQATGAFWQEASHADVERATGAVQITPPRNYHAATLDRAGIAKLAAGAPSERAQDAAQSALVISLPHPDGGYQRFAIVDSPVMEAGLAAQHPEIRTYAGKGLDDTSATLRMDITPLGLHASVRSPKGAWYVDPAVHRNDNVYTAYHRRDLANRHGSFKESAIDAPQLSTPRSFYHAGDMVEVHGAGFAPGATVSVTVHNPETDFGPVQNLVAIADSDGVVSFSVVADPTRNAGAYQITANDGRATSTASYQVVSGAQSANAASGTQLRTYRLALISDPSYASYFGAANVTAAKVTLINRVTQVYESETSIRMMLIDATDKLNLATADAMTGANGPCGGNACYTADEASGCGGALLTRNKTVIGLLAGASNFDIGHIALGLNGGGVASLGVVGAPNKAQGCTGIPTPVGDFYAVDYVAHEMGHQFAGNHPFNGVISNCSGANRNAQTSVEPGSGTSIMAYAGICGTDNLQPHSDAYWSQRSFDEIVGYTSGTETPVDEVQAAVLRGFGSAGQQFQLQYNGKLSPPIVVGANYTANGIAAAVAAIPGWPAGATVSIEDVTSTGFTINFGGTLGGVQAGQLMLANCTSACSGYVGEIVAGGPTTRRGAVTATNGSAPVVTVPAGYTIPVQTPFALTGSATGAPGATLTYMWEQNDRGAAQGTGLISNIKTNGPLFRQFGLRAVVSKTDTLLYGSPGENLVTTNPTRVFPDMAQILANNTNAVSGACPAAATPPTAADIDCYSEFLPTAAYTGYSAVNGNPPSLTFRLTARDGHGGVGSASTSLVLAPNAGPFLVTSHNSAVTVNAGSTQTVTWNVAGTDAAPVGAASVKISLSTDGGASFPYVLAASTPNNGSKTVTMPAVSTSAARIKIEALGNVFFDVNDANFTIKQAGK